MGRAYRDGSLVCGRVHVRIARVLNDFERRYNEIAQPFDWSFTRDDLADLLKRLDERERESALALAA